VPLSFKVSSPEIEAECEEGYGKGFNRAQIDEISANRTALHTPIFEFDATNGLSKLIKGIPAHQRRPLSICFNQKTCTLAVTYTSSCMTMLVDTLSGTMRTIASKDYDFDTFLGVASIPNTDWIALSDSHSGILIYDTLTHKPVEVIRVNLNASPHLTFW